MSVFSVPVVIGVDEERIAKEIEANVEKMVVEKITNEVEEIIFYKRSYYGMRDEPLKAMIRSQIDNILRENEKIIIETAATKLAEKLVRTKAAKERAAKVAEEVLG